MGKLDIIEPPSPFAPAKEWEEFLAKMEAREQTHTVKMLIEEAKAELADRERRVKREAEEKET